MTSLSKISKKQKFNQKIKSKIKKIPKVLKVYQAIPYSVEDEN